MRGYPAVTGRVYDTGRSIVQMESADINAPGDLVIYENVNSDGTPADPGFSEVQRIVLLSAASNYTSGQTIIDLGDAQFDSNVLLQIGQIFNGIPSVVALAYGSTPNQSTLYTYRPENGVQSTVIGGHFNSMTFANLTGGGGTPQVLLTSPNGITVFAPVVTAATIDEPQGYDPSKPLQFVNQQFFADTDFASVAAVKLDGPVEDLYSVVYDSSGQFEIERLNNAYLAHQPSGDAAGALYDFAVVVPGSTGGTIAGQVYYDINQSGTWDPGDYGVYNGVTVYLDLNGNGLLDPTEPQQTPDSQGRYAFTQLTARSYQLGIQLASGYKLTTSAKPVVTLENLPLVRIDGVDFGVHSGDVGSDLNGDGKPDLLLTDNTSLNVYVQLRDGFNRLASYKIGTLPSAEWAVAGIYDITGDGSADVVIYNQVTGELRAWDFRPTPGVPVLAKTITLDYRLPAGFKLLGIADIDNDAKPELIVGNKSTGEHRLVKLDGVSTASELPLAIPAATEVIAVGDIDQDGDADLLLRDRTTGHLLIDVWQDGKSSRIIDIGQPKADWEAAGIIDLVAGGPKEILFQEKSTGNAYVWKLNSDLTVADTVALDIGTHDGLRLHLAEDLAPTVSISPVVASNPVNSIKIVFSEKVTGFDLADLSLARDGGRNLLANSRATLTSSDGGMTWTLGNLKELTGGVGSYTLTLNAVSSNIVNAAGTPLAVGASTIFKMAAPLAIFASQTTVTGTTVQLSAFRGNVDSSTIYTWSVTNKPKGAGNPTFSLNGSKPAQNVKVTFSSAGAYTFKVVATTDGVKQSATIVIDVVQTLTKISIKPSSATVHVKETQPFSASVLDQFGISMSGEKITWSIDAGGVGKIDKSGVYTAPKDTGSATVRATVGGKSGTARVTIIPAPLPLGISANVRQVTGTTVQLSAIHGNVDSSTIYTWSVITKPPGAKTPKININQSRQATSVIAIFFEAGSYAFKLVATTGSRTESAAITMNVVQTASKVAISPATITLFEKSKQQFSASLLDQFGNMIAKQPNFSWSVEGGGSTTKNGLYTAPASAGSARIRASGGGQSAVALIRIAQISHNNVQRPGLQDLADATDILHAHAANTSTAWSTAHFEGSSDLQSIVGIAPTSVAKPGAVSETRKMIVYPQIDDSGQVKRAVVAHTFSATQVIAAENAAAADLEADRKES
jgi:hypothetical protein